MITENQLWIWKDGKGVGMVTLRTELTKKWSWINSGDHTYNQQTNYPDQVHYHCLVSQFFLREIRAIASDPDEEILLSMSRTAALTDIVDVRGPDFWP